MKKNCFLKMTALLVFFLCISCFSNFETANAATNYSIIPNRKIYWAAIFSYNHHFREGEVSTRTLAKYNTFVYGKPKKGDKVAYLTFTCDREYGYTKKLLAILKKNKIKATFFVTGNYIKDKNNVIKEMKQDGHLVGNHTASHSYYSSYSVARIKKDVSDCAKLMKEKTGYSMDPYFRPPSGEFSLRSLKVAQNLGYTSFLWSYAYRDYLMNKQPSVTTVINGFKKYHHNGMIPLIHTNSTANVKALPDVIKYLKKQGYRFGSLKELRKRTLTK